MYVWGMGIMKMVGYRIYLDYRMSIHTSRRTNEAVGLTTEGTSQERSYIRSTTSALKTIAPAPYS